MKQIKDYILIDTNWLQAQINFLQHQQVLKNYENSEINFKLEYLKELQRIGINAEILANKAYEAGKLDKELSLSFDNVKARFINQKIKL
jgi:hypothetical protein